MNSVSVAKNWFSSLFTNNLIRPMPKQYLQFRYERGEGLYSFIANLFTHNSLVCLFDCPLIPYLEKLGSIICFSSSQFSDVFVDKQPLYIRTATETEFIVN